jgi:hypothetical protein
VIILFSIYVSISMVFIGVSRPKDLYSQWHVTGLCCFTLRLVLVIHVVDHSGCAFWHTYSLLLLWDWGCSFWNALEKLVDWFAVHHSITLVDLQLGAQNSCLFIYNTFIKIVYMFRALPCSSSGGLRRISSGIVTLCRWPSCAPVKKVLFQLVHKTVTCREW